MRSLTGCRAADMDRLFWCSLLLNFLKLSEGCTNSESCLSQPDEVFWRKTGQSVDLPCTISSPCSGSRWQYEWLACKEQRCYQLKLHENPQKYQPNGASLHITTLQANDSGIYHCAAVSGQQQANQGCQHVGLGTTLMVRENIKTTVRHIYLWVCFALLFVYSLAVVAFIVKKNGCQRIHKLDQFNLTKRTQFRDVLQEMNKKKLRKVRKATSEDGQEAGASREDLNNSHDDIYQNV